ncbi:MAG: hypothetical protein A2X49_17400 [Lentisphaerae bacterium GWF2_52_8]|nr:MAG: hypothetical protein A2X49_17400 [Lentisphaerae bacterium GWF2_52_8]
MRAVQPKNTLCLASLFSFFSGVYHFKYCRRKKISCHLVSFIAQVNTIGKDKRVDNFPILAELLQKTVMQVT